VVATPSRNPRTRRPLPTAALPPTLCRTAPTSRSPARPSGVAEGYPESAENPLPELQGDGSHRPQKPRLTIGPEVVCVILRIASGSGSSKSSLRYLRAPCGLPSFGSWSGALSHMSREGWEQPVTPYSEPSTGTSPLHFLCPRCGKFAAPLDHRVCRNRRTLQAS